MGIKKPNKKDFVAKPGKYDSLHPAVGSIYFIRLDCDFQENRLLSIVEIIEPTGSVGNS